MKNRTFKVGDTIRPTLKCIAWHLANLDIYNSPKTGEIAPERLSAVVMWKYGAKRDLRPIGVVTSLGNNGAIGVEIYNIYGSAFAYLMPDQLQRLVRVKRIARVWK